MRFTLKRRNEVNTNVYVVSVVPSTHGRAQSQPSATDKNISLYTNPIHILSVLYILPLSQDGGGMLRIDDAGWGGYASGSQKLRICIVTFGIIATSEIIIVVCRMVRWKAEHQSSSLRHTAHAGFYFP